MRIASSKPSQSWKVCLLVCLILIAALLLRVVNLDADPSAFLSRDFITDEGWWAHNVRNVISFGRWRIGDYNPGLYSAFLHNYLLYFAMKVFGPGLTAVRLLSAIAGWLTVVLVFLWVRRETNLRTAIFATILLGFSNLHIMYSRTGFVESTLVFFLALALWLWSLRREHYLFALMSGVACGLMLITKVTAIYFAPGLILLAMSEAIRKKANTRDLLLLLSGALLSGGAYAVAFVAPHFGEWKGFLLASAVGNEWPRQPSDLIYSGLKVLSSRFYTEAPVLTALTLLALGHLIIRMSKEGASRAIRSASELEIISATLLIGYFVSLAPTVYQPQRRFIPALLLMVILSANFLSAGFASLEDLLRGDKIGAGGWFTVLFLLPAILIVKLKWSVLGSPFTISFWLAKAVLVVALILMSRAISRGQWPYPVRHRLLWASSVIFTLLFSELSFALVLKSLGLWGADRAGIAQPLLISSTVGLAFVVATLAFRLGARHFATLAISAFLVVEAFQVSTWLPEPTFTLKEADHSLATITGDKGTIVTRYETLFLSSGARVICYWPREGFNIEAFEKFNPDYILILRRDNWEDFPLEQMPREEWPPPVNQTPKQVTSFDLCPTRANGPRFIAELYRLDANKAGQRLDSSGLNARQ